MEFLKSLFSQDNSVIHTPYVIAAFVVIALATPIVFLSSIIVIYNVFYLHRPLDGPQTQLLLGLLGAATGGLATALFSKTTTYFSQSTQSGLGLGSPTTLPGLKTGAPKPDVPEEV